MVKNPFGAPLSRRSTKFGNAGYDNPRENIDPHIKTKVIQTKELIIDTVWDDQQVNISAVGFGASAPTKTAYKGSEILAFNKAQDNQIFFNIQLSHKYKIGTNINFHIHLVHPDAGAGTTRWKFSYSWAKIGSNFPTETIVFKNCTCTGADTHQINDIIDITPPENMGTSSILLCSLTREGTDLSDTYDNNIYLVGLDFHLELDGIGSKNELFK